MIAALYVETGGCYFGLPDVDPWDEPRDARLYAGNSPVVAHPPCQRWGRYATGGVRANQRGKYDLGADCGCFAAALAAVRRCGGVLEHPCDSRAWEWHGLTRPKRHAGWQQADDHGGMTCYVEQGHYGHFSRKATWLYARTGAKLPELNWTKGAQRLHPVALGRYGYEKARRIGMIAMVGGKTAPRSEMQLQWSSEIFCLALREAFDHHPARTSGPHHTTPHHITGRSMTASHTPGPLAVIRSASGKPLIIADHPQHVGDIAKLQDTPEGWATAQLFSAAPDLLQALKDLDEAYSRAGAPLTKQERHEDRLRLIAARAAIAKATGEKA